MPACSLWSHVCNMGGTKSAIARLPVLKRFKQTQTNKQPTHKQSSITGINIFLIGTLART